MRHRKKINHLSRKTAHRKAMLSNMAASLIMHKRINTTLAKAKALRSYIEPLITKSKEDTTHSRRMVFSYLQNKEAVTELFRDISVKVADRPGGYTRIIKTGARLGDNAEMCMMELVDFNENMLAAKADKPSRRKRRGGSKKSTGEATAAVADEVAEEVVEDVAATEAAEEVVAAEVVEEVVEEAVVAEVAEEVVEEVKAEAAEVVEEKVEEAKPVAEAKPEEAKEEKKEEDSKADDEKDKKE